MKGKVVLVTGGSLGIGKATVKLFASEGATVLFCSRNEEHGKKLEKEILEDGKSAEWIKCDVTSAIEVKNLIDIVVEKYGRLDIAFNNAMSGAKSAPVADMDEEAWDKNIEGGLKSVFLCMKYEIPELIKTGGVIVNNSSVDGLRGFPGHSAYSAAKHGVIGLTKSAALEYAKQGLRINVICPGWVETESIKKWKEFNPDVQKMIEKDQPAGKAGNPDEIAQAVLWLSSEKASFVNGSVFNIDGGFMA